jgi:hypothetical protein
MISGRHRSGEENKHHLFTFGIYVLKNLPLSTHLVSLHGMNGRVVTQPYPHCLAELALAGWETEFPDGPEGMEERVQQTSPGCTDQGLAPEVSYW